MVAASSFSHYTGTLTFNTTSEGGGNYVNQANTHVDGVSDQGTHSNFAAQQRAPNGNYDTLTEANIATTLNLIIHQLQSGWFNNARFRLTQQPWQATMDHT